MQKTLQRRRMHAAVGKRGVQQFVHRLGRLRAQPREQPRPAAERPQRLGEQRMRRDKIDARRAALAKNAQRRPPVGALRPRGRAASPTACPARPIASAIRLSSSRPPSGLVSTQAKVRSSCGSSTRRPAPAGPAPPAARSAPAGPARPPARRATSAPAPVPRAKRVPAAHQHHHIARHRAPFRLSSSTEPSVCWRSIRPAPRPAVAAPRRPLVALGHRPGHRLVRRTARRQRPEFHRARMARAVGVDGSASRRPSTTPRGGERIGEHRVDQRQHRRGRAERDIQRFASRHGSGAPASRVRRAARARGRNSSTSAPWNEKIDCLRSPTAKTVRCVVARACAGEELLGQARARCAIVRARCPAPRPAANDPARRPACKAPRRRRDRSADPRCARSGRRIRAGRPAACAPHRRSSPARRGSQRGGNARATRSGTELIVRPPTMRSALGEQHRTQIGILVGQTPR